MTDHERAFAAGLRPLLDYALEAIRTAEANADADEKTLAALLENAQGLLDGALEMFRPEVLVRAAVWTLLGDAATHRELASAAIMEASGRAGSDEEIASLAHAVGTHLSRLTHEAGLMDEAPPAGTPWPHRGGMLGLDAVAADHLEAMGVNGAETARDIRARARREWSEWTGRQATIPGTARARMRIAAWLPLWQLWYAPAAASLTPVHFARVLAPVLWLDVVRPRLERAGCAQMPIPALQQMVAAFSAPNRRVQRWTHDRVALVSRDDRPIALASALVVPAAMLNGEWLPEGVEIMRLARWIPLRVHEQLSRAGITTKGRSIPDSQTTIRVRGGIKGLAVAMRLRESAEKVDGRMVAKLRAGLEWLRLWDLVLPVQGGAPAELHGQLIWALLPGSEDRRQQDLVIEPGYIFRPGALFDLRKGRGRKLAPIPHREPPLLARRCDMTAQLALQVEVLAEMADRRMEMPAGGVEISPHRWRLMADKVSLSPKLIPEIHNLWCAGRDPDPPFLARLPDGRWTLAAAYWREKAAILAGAKYSEQGRKAATSRWQARENGRPGRRRKASAAIGDQ